MKNESRTKLFLVDDDAVYLKLLEVEFHQHTDFAVETFATGELCMERLLSETPDIIVLDYHLDGIEKTAMNGLETLNKIKAFNDDIPVVMLSSQDKIDVAINCLHHNAFDYVVKSETSFIRLKKIVNIILRYRKLEFEMSKYMAMM